MLITLHTNTHIVRHEKALKDVSMFTTVNYSIRLNQMSFKFIKIKKVYKRSFQIYHKYKFYLFHFWYCTVCLCVLLSQGIKFFMLIRENICYVWFIRLVNKKENNEKGKEQNYFCIPCTHVLHTLNYYYYWFIYSNIVNKEREIIIF